MEQNKMPFESMLLQRQPCKAQQLRGHATLPLHEDVRLAISAARCMLPRVLQVLHFLTRKTPFLLESIASAGTYYR